jgi:hypothetical protein
MPRALRPAVLALALVAGLMVPASADSALLEPVAGSDNLTHIINEPYERRDGSAGAVTATDSDFYTVDLSTLPAAAQARLPKDVGPTEERVFNVMGTYLHGMQIFDITDREKPVKASVYDCVIQQADVFIFTQDELDDDGEVVTTRTYAAYTSDAVSGPGFNPDSVCHADNPESQGRRGTFLVDITNPYEPESAGFLPMRKGTHQVTVHPSGDFVYNSAAVLVTTSPGTIEVYDVSNLHEKSNDELELVSELELLTGLDVHDMTFDESGDRLYAAALTHSFVIDSSDPADPSIVGRIYDPAVNIHHDAHKVTVEGPLGDRDFMLIGDELAGAGGNAFCPGGGIHVYDVTGPLENAPVKVGAFFIPDVRPAGTGGTNGTGLTCTAHVIQPIPGTTLLSVAWYNAGVRILDYSGLGTLNGAGLQVGAANTSVTPGITQVGYSYFTNSNLWSAKVLEVEEDGFYVYGGDTRRGLDVWRFDAEGIGAGDTTALRDATAEVGTWLAPQAALQQAAVARLGSTLSDGYAPFCLLPGQAV